VSDEELAEQWELAALGRSVGHEEHVRIARALVRRYGRADATRRLVAGTLRNCAALGVPERFDEDLTRRWSERIADSVEAGDGPAFEDFVSLHPELLRSDLLGAPAWRSGS
jgi:hypothetical protein